MAESSALNGLLEQVRKISFDEIRKDEDRYFEAVVATPLLGTLEKTLQGYFGTAFKPAGDEPSGEASAISAAHGGLEREQTLYCIQKKPHLHLAMLWPWGSGLKVTLKIGVLETAPVPKKSWFQKILGR